LKKNAPSRSEPNAAVGAEGAFPTDLLDLKAFCLVVDLGSLTAAASMLGETKGTVSRRITRLEEALGASLVRRSPRLVQATEEGAAYRARVGRALEALEDANAEVQQAKAAPRGHLRVTVPTDLGLYVFAPLVASFAERFPEVSVEMILTEALLDFDAHQIDVALRAGSGLKDSSLVAQKLEEVHAGFFASPRYLDRFGKPRQPEDLHRHRLLVARARRGHAALTLTNESDESTTDLSVRAAISASDFSFCREVALADGGVALLPAIVAERDVRDKRLVEVMDKYSALEGALYFVHHGARMTPPKVRAFRDHLVDAFRARRR
jgi:DNA-binding transcriptional LysR family regulator